MTRLPVVSAGDVIKVLEGQGFQVVRQRGSHLVLQKRTPTTTVTTVVRITRNWLRARCAVS